MIGLRLKQKKTCCKLLHCAKRFLKKDVRYVAGRVQVNVGVSTFVPKPHTPFQWCASDPPELIQEKQELLRRELRHRQIKLSWTNPAETMLEAVLSRGNRQLAQAIYLAWKKGCKFDAWQDHFKAPLWQEAYEEAGINIAEIIYRKRSFEEKLPWEHIHAGVEKSFLYRDFEWSLQGKIRADCRTGCYNCGILTRFRDLPPSLCHSRGVDFQRNGKLSKEET
jgi:hypothetical protein